MTLGEKICAAGVTTLGEYLCLETGGGTPGDIFYYGTTNIVEEQGLSLSDAQDIITIEEAVMIQEQQEETVFIDDTNIIEIQEQEIIDGIC